MNAVGLIESMGVTQRGIAIPFNHSQDRLFFVQVLPRPNLDTTLFLYLI